MVDTSHQMGFPLQGGSSLAVTWRVPSVEFPLGATVHEAVSVGYGGMGSYDFHGLETIQCMVERRKGGETGVEWLQTYRGDGFWTGLPAGGVVAGAGQSGVVPQFHPGAGEFLPLPICFQRSNRCGPWCPIPLPTTISIATGCAAPCC